MNVAELSAGLRARRDFEDLRGEAAPLRPAQVHAQEHVGPVLRVGTAGPGVHRADRVAVVVLAREQREQLEIAEPRRERRESVDELAARTTRRSLPRELRERLEVGELLVERVVELDVVAVPRQLGGDLARERLVVPEVGFAHLLFELDDPGARGVDPEIRRATPRGGGADR